MRKKWIPMYAAILLMLAGSNATAEARTSPSAAPPQQTRLEAEVQHWTEALSEQPRFSIWKDAERTIAPIGPGQHGWLVTFLHERRPVGYMIVNATQDGGFALGEYGVGTHPAFDPNAIYESLVRQGFFPTYKAAVQAQPKLERKYIHPLLAVWQWTEADGTVRYFDAFTAEALPVDSSSWQKQSADPQFSAASGQQREQAKLASFRLNAAFDPYARLPWLTSAPLGSSDVGRLTRLLDQKKEIRFAAELYHQTVLFVWSAIGYHNWDNGQLYVAIDNDFGTRYIPLELLRGSGRFYR
ncbi:hypothetical protein [Paenibacillus humicola]|uniref:hypothetical protein n=1 Tax=Paenibacillus humicola TaxID=3110540 RepID=UPI00237B0DCC|nr:hypothetical protein [Paenibacillus humicola]